VILLVPILPVLSRAAAPKQILQPST